MTIKMEAVKEHHFSDFKYRSEELLRFQVDSTLQQKLEYLALNGPSLAMIDGGKVIAFMGYFEMWPGCYEVWCIPSVFIYSRAVLYLRTVRRYLNVIERTRKIRRVQTVAPNDDKHNRWMRFFGFENETPNGMREYSCTGDTFNLWSRIPGGLCYGA